MCAAQRNRKIKSKRAIPEWKLVGPSDLPCSSDIGSVSIPHSCWLELLEKALDSQPTFEILEKKDTYYSFKITQFLKDNFWSIIGHKLQLSLLRKKKNILRPEMSKLLGLCQIIIPKGKVRCRRVSLFNKMTYLGIYDREPLKLSIVHMNKWLLCHGALQ